jgi:hypothetical protein
MISREKRCLALLLLLAAAGSAALRNNAPEGIERENYTVRFISYETTVEVKGAPEEVGKYLLKPKNFLNYQTDTARWESNSDKMLEQAGDTVGYTIVSGKVRTPMIGILVNYEPGAEVWYFFTGESGVLADLKLHLEPFQSGSKLRLKYEDEVFSSAQDIEENQKTRELTAKVFEMMIAKIQQHFDPSQKPEELLKEGIRGEFADPIYDAYRASIRINASPKKIHEYLRGPALQKYQKEYGDWMGKLFFRSEPGPFPAKIATDDIKQDLVGFPALSTSGLLKGGYHSTGYLMPKSASFITKNQITIKAEKGGSVLSINFLISSNRVDSADMYELAVMETKLPAPVDRFLQGVKQDLEGGQE